MKQVAIWYHAKISGEGIPNPEYAFSVALSQLVALRESGLAARATEFHIGINGGNGDALLIAASTPHNPIIHVHGDSARTEIPTLEALRRWLPGHEDWAILYHHTKGVTHAGDKVYTVWRECMERGCVWNWENCLREMDRGVEACGCHWLTPEKYPGAIKTPMFGGTFWWASARYLLTLPQLPPARFENRYEAESWIGRGRRRPRVVDFHAQWPGLACGQK